MEKEGKNELVKNKVKNVKEMREELRKACNLTSCRQCPLIDYNCSSLFDASASIDTVVKAYHERFSSQIVDYLHEEVGRQLLEEVNIGQRAKADEGKPIFTWVPPAIIRAIERVRAFGNKKYHDPDNWRQVSAQRYWDAYLRHTIAAWWDFRKKDKESGLRHIDHCACNLAFIMQFLEDEELGLELPDDGLHCKHCLYFDEDEDGKHCSECKYAHVDNFVRKSD